MVRLALHDSRFPLDQESTCCPTMLQVLIVSCTALRAWCPPALGAPQLCLRFALAASMSSRPGRILILGAHCGSSLISPTFPSRSYDQKNWQLKTYLISSKGASSSGASGRAAALAFAFALDFALPLAFALALLAALAFALPAGLAFAFAFSLGFGAGAALVWPC